MKQPKLIRKGGQIFGYVNALDKKCDRLIGYYNFKLLNHEVDLDFNYVQHMLQLGGNIVLIKQTDLAKFFEKPR